MENKDYHMYMTYQGLVSKRNDHSKSFYMLAELIDNSIASWDNNNMKEKLKINITLDMNKSIIIVSDNAFGMTEEELAESLRLHKEKEGNVLNMFGVGMKNAAFWFGQDLVVRTKCKETSKAYSTKIETSEVKNLSETIIWNVIPADREKHGTDVIFKNLYEEKIIKRKEFIEEIVPILQNKYRNYILNKVIEIVISYVNSKENKIVILSPKPIKAELIKAENKEEFLKNLDQNLVGLKRIKDLKEKVIDLVNRNKPLFFDLDIPFHTHELKFYFGIKKQNNKEYDTEGNIDESRNFKKKLWFNDFSERQSNKYI